MSSSDFEKILNFGLINSTVYMTYLNKNTLTGDPRDLFILNATIIDDSGNCIVEKNVTFVAENHNNTDIRMSNNR